MKQVNTTNTETTSKPVDKLKQTGVTGSKDHNTTTKPLTKKQQAFVNYLIDNPKSSATQAVLATYGKEGKPVTYMSAGQIAHENLRKPEIVSAMSSYNELAESTIKRVMTDWGEDVTPRKRELALQAAYYTHDKIHGKATQRVEQTTTGVTLSIDLTSSLPEATE